MDKSMEARVGLLHWSATWHAQHAFDISAARLSSIVPEKSENSLVVEG